MLAGLERVPLDRYQIRLADAESGEFRPVGNRLTFLVRGIVLVEIALLPRGRACSVAAIVEIGTLLKICALVGFGLLGRAEELITEQAQGEKEGDCQDGKPGDAPEAMNRS